MADINQSSIKFAHWLENQVEDLGGCDHEALRAKYEEMRVPSHGSERDRAKAFHCFLRGTFYRWAEHWKGIDASAPKIHAVGDTHVENFGTWRDAEGRLVWGVNDFDESCVLPWTSDLIRLGVSARLALDALEVPPLKREVAVQAIFDGYAKSMADSATAALVLAENHETLRGFALDLILSRSPGKFWEKRRNETGAAPDLPRDARAALQTALPEGAAKVEFRQLNAGRFRGMGSRGKRRYYAFAQWHGSDVLREAKPIIPSSATLAGFPPEPGLKEILASTRRCPDPTVRICGKWMVRRLAPDASKIQLKDLEAHAKRAAATELFASMGMEIANLHRGSKGAGAVVDDLETRGNDRRWFAGAVEQWEGRLRRDWEEFDPGTIK